MRHSFLTKKTARADRIIAAELPFLRLGFLRKLFRKKEIKVASQPVGAEAQIPTGSQVTIFLPDPRRHFAALTGSSIVVEDDDIIAFDKAPDTPSVEGVGTRGRSLKAMAETLLETPLTAVHRLDAGTSGVIIFAKTGPVARKLEAAFRTRQAQKTYRAVVSQKPREEHGTIRESLKKVGQKVQVRADGLSAETIYEVQEKKTAGWLVACRPQTGRMHQIRVHLQSIGCPIVGDATYGGTPHERMMLHAKELKICGYTLSAALPDAFAQ